MFTCLLFLNPAAHPYLRCVRFPRVVSVGWISDPLKGCWEIPLGFMPFWSRSPRNAFSRLCRFFFLAASGIGLQSCIILHPFKQNIMSWPKNYDLLVLTGERDGLYWLWGWNLCGEISSKRICWGRGKIVLRWSRGKKRSMAYILYIKISIYVSEVW